MIMVSKHQKAITSLIHIQQGTVKMYRTNNSPGERYQQQHDRAKDLTFSFQPNRSGTQKVIKEIKCIKEEMEKNVLNRHLWGSQLEKNIYLSPVQVRHFSRKTKIWKIT